MILLLVKMQDTLSYDTGRYATENGWPSRFSFLPDFMTGMNNDFFTFKNGDIWIHHSNNVPRCNYYGVQYAPKVRTVFNEFVDDDKLFKTINLDSSAAWSTIITSDMSSGIIEDTWYTKKETEWYGYIRRTDTDVITGNDTLNLSTQGLGTVQSWAIDTLTFSFVLNNSKFAVGDIIYKVSGSSLVEVGPIESYTATTIVIDTPLVVVVAGDMIVVGKNKIAESNGVRGYFTDIELTYNGIESVELFSVGAEMFKSFP